MKTEAQRLVAARASKKWRANHLEQHRAYARAYRDSIRTPCQVCGALKKPTAKVCRSCMRGANAGNWKGGVHRNPDGYRLIMTPENSFSSHLNGYLLEHRYVMEQHLGRALFPDETVHHRNGVRDDNRLENLELWSSRHPKGQKVEDLVAWAHEVLSRYGGKKSALR